MTLVFASGPLYAALHQPVCVVVVSVLPASPWPVAVLVCSLHVHFVNIVVS